MSITVMDTREAAAFVRLGKNTLERFRLTGEGPAFLKLGGSVRYRQTDLEAWLESRLTHSTSERSA
ncbi:helix-turn-helix transcriptional regulator [Sphingorhabdus contaminans]|uniref:Helix-turn-helix domain-containing protein n=1 Tax=Sphingorhabdus contaminans TaxID=1343899 RepID=A0A553WGZ6_9SPHN|nr:helix-turn-helix domain-containing protein [Sphingorhabdus contaminans]TSB03969.1 helix-turn-helix domain-containing protein [Sphingorhabdus contaminans]